jgi:hypothetical protein
MSVEESHEARVSLNSSGLTPTAASTAVSGASGVGLRRVLLAVAAFETLLGLLDFYEIFDLHDPKRRMNVPDEMAGQLDAAQF